MLAPGHDLGMRRGVRARSGRRRAAGSERGGHEHDRLPAIAADPFWVPELDRFISDAASRGWRPRRSIACNRSARSTRAPPGSWRCPPRPTPHLDLVPATLGGELKPFQRAGVEYLLKQRRSFLADEQGLGKTIEALATIEADGAYPAIVVCPASLKLNWMREIERWLPARSAQMLDGNRGAVPHADLTVVNYDIVAGRLDALARARSTRRRARRVALLQEPGRQAHPGRPAALRRRTARGSRAGSDRDAADEPAAGADLPAADPRAPRRLRVRARSSASASAARMRTSACIGICGRDASPGG